MIRILAAAAAAFGADMTDEEMGQTGIAKLTVQERITLQNWIDGHTSKKGEAKKGPILQEVLRSGRFVRLSDHSLWEIDPSDTPITQSWITPVEIKANATLDAEYPYTLTNTLTGSIVKARKAVDPK